MKKNNNKIRIAILAAITSQAVVMVEVGLAQGPALEEIVITSTRRETNVQDTPLAVTAITSEALELQNIENTQDLATVVPNVLFYGGGRGTTNGVFNMRGIPNVGVYIDDVWQVSNSGLLQRQFVELDRIEVLRGPQGTLVGRDSTGGSIIMHTKGPADEFGGRVNLGMGSFDRRDVSASVDIPITETLLTKWTIASYDKDGYVESITTGKKHGELQNTIFRGDIIWEPTDTLSFRLIRQEDEQASTDAGVQTFINYDVAYRFGWQVGIAEAHDIASRAGGGRGFSNQSTVAGFAGGDLDDFQSTKKQLSPNTVDIKSTTLIANWDVTDIISVKYVFGDTESQNSIWTDYAGAEFNFFTNYDVASTNYTSHEVQVNFDLDVATLVIGAFTWDQEVRTRGTEWSHSDWSFPDGWGAGGAGGASGGPFVGQTINSGVAQTLSYDDVLSSPTCAMTPADYGYDFSSSDPNLNPSILGGNGQFSTIDPSLDPNTVAGWPRPCDAFNSWVPLFSTVVGFNGPSAAHDRGTLGEEEGHAFFAEGTYYINDQWDVTLGVRHHTQDNKNYELDVIGGVANGTVEGRPEKWDVGFADLEGALDNPVIIPSSLTEASFSKTTYRFATSYEIMDDVMAYFSYSEGFNSGGIDVTADSLGRLVTEYDPETIENIEIGLRGDFFDSRLRVNATYFMTDWIDIQANSSVIDRGTGDPITEVFTTNASDGEANGLELEITFAATDNLLLGANLGWLDTKYVNLKPGAQITNETEFGGAPDETHNLYAQYVLPLSSGDLMGRISAQYSGDFWRSSIPNFRQDVYGGEANSPAGDIWRYNARVVYTPSDGNYEISAFVNNITDEVYLNSGFMDSIWQFDFSGVDAPREFGIGLTMNFQ